MDKPVGTKSEDEPVKVRKPAGGISLFGGIDPFAARKNLRSPAGGSGKSNIEESSEPGDLFASERTTPRSSYPPKKLTTTKPLITKSEVVYNQLSIFRSGSSLEEEVSNKNVENVTAQSKDIVLEESTGTNNEAEVRKTGISALHASLNINPHALLPGTSAIQKEIPIKPASFDEPVDIKTLENVSKNRVRGQAKRRPPTRKRKHSDNVHANISDCRTSSDHLIKSFISSDKASNSTNININTRPVIDTSDTYNDWFSSDQMPVTTKTKLESNDNIPCDFSNEEDSLEITKSKIEHDEVDIVANDNESSICSKPFDNISSKRIVDQKTKSEHDEADVFSSDNESNTFPKPFDNISSKKVTDQTVDQTTKSEHDEVDIFANDSESDILSKPLDNASSKKITDQTVDQKTKSSKVCQIL